MFFCRFSGVWVEPDTTHISVCLVLHPSVHSQDGRKQIADSQYVVHMTAHGSK